MSCLCHRTYYFENITTITTWSSWNTCVLWVYISALAQLVGALSQVGTSKGLVWKASSRPGAERSHNHFSCISKNIFASLFSWIYGVSKIVVFTRKIYASIVINPERPISCVCFRFSHPKTTLPLIGMGKTWLHLIFKQTSIEYRWHKSITFAPGHRSVDARSNIQPNGLTWHGYTPSAWYTAFKLTMNSENLFILPW